MHHLVFGLNFQIHSVSLTILVSIYLLIHFSTHLCHHPHSRHPSLLHSFTPGSKPTLSTNPSHRRFLLPILDCLTITGLDRTYNAHHFFKFHILIFCLFRVVDKAGYPSPFYCTLNTHYRDSDSSPVSPR